MKSLSKWLIMLALPFAMSAMMVGCTGPSAVEGEEDNNNNVSDDEYEQMMQQGEQEAMQNNGQ